MHFEKISFTQWCSDVSFANVDESTVCKWYDNIKIPQQGSKYSMGCDFFLPMDIVINKDDEVKIPTGIRMVSDCDEDYKFGMLLIPRSGLGTKYGIRIKNTIGVIDADYFQSDNEGHIFAILVNPSKQKEISLDNGQAFMQGVVVPFIIPSGSESDKQRNGGFGSTDKSIT